MKKRIDELIINWKCLIAKYEIALKAMQIENYPVEFKSFILGEIETLKNNIKDLEDMKNESLGIAKGDGSQNKN